jgi:hypothetical protein
MAMASFGLALHVVPELVPFFVLPVAQSAGLILHLVSEVVDFVVEALPSGLAAHAN